MASRSSITVRLLGQDYRIAREGDGASEDQIHAAASVVEETMRKLRERTGTVDTLHVAVLAALNIARRYIAHREVASRPTAGDPIDGDRIRALIELVESATAEVPGAS